MDQSKTITADSLASEPIYQKTATILKLVKVMKSDLPKFDSPHELF